MYLLEVHFAALAAGGSAVKAHGMDADALLAKARKNTKKRVRELRDCIGFNVAALRFLQSQLAPISLNHHNQKKAKINV